MSSTYLYGGYGGGRGVDPTDFVYDDDEDVAQQYDEDERGVQGTGDYADANISSTADEATRWRSPALVDETEAAGPLAWGSGGGGLGTLGAEEAPAHYILDQQQQPPPPCDPRTETLPRILIMGPRRAGKTSIQRVVFHKMSPHETLFRLETTQVMERTIVDHTRLCRFTIWDFPGDYYASRTLGTGGGATTGMTPLTRGSGYGGQRGHGDGQYEYFQSEQLSYDDRARSEGQGDVKFSPGLNAKSTTQNTSVNHGHGNTHSDSVSAGSDAVASTAATTEADADQLIYPTATVLIFVMDAQDEPYDHVLQDFIYTVSRAVRINPSIAIEVFINKVDGELFLSDEAKYDCRRDIMQQVTDELHVAGLGDIVSVSYHLTSIYDHSIFEALSRVVQKLILPLQPTLENLLNVLVSSCGMVKAYLFDVASKLYISTDSSPVDMQSVELCSDMIDVVLDVSGIYGSGVRTTKDEQLIVRAQNEDVSSEHQQRSGLIAPNVDEIVGQVKIQSPSDIQGEGNANPASISATGSNAAKVFISDNDKDLLIPSATETSADELIAQENQADRISLITEGSQAVEDDREADVAEGNAPSSCEAEGTVEGSAYDDKSASVIRLSNGMVLYLKEVDSMLALICLTRYENFHKKSLIDYNISCLKRALKCLVEPCGTEIKER